MIRLKILIKFMRNKTNTILQIIVYKVINNKPIFLFLKRSEDRGGFWNAVNGTLEVNEDINQCRERELFEETGIRAVLNWSPELHRFNFDFKGRAMTVLVFSAQVDKDQDVIINEEHVDYKWLSFIDAKDILKFDDDKQSLKISNEFIKLNK